MQLPLAKVRQSHQTKAHSVKSLPTPVAQHTLVEKRQKPNLKTLTVT